MGEGERRAWTSNGTLPRLGSASRPAPGVISLMAKTPAKVGRPPESALSSAPTPAPLLDEPAIERALTEAPEWSSLADTIQRTFQFKNFAEALAFVQAVALVAEADQHHPDILIRYNKVTLTLSTHDSGGVTGKDFDAARKYDALVGKK